MTAPVKTKRSRLAVIAPAAVGLLFGLIAAAVFSRWNSGRQAAGGAPAEQRTETIVSVAAPDGNLSQLRRQLADLTKRQQALEDEAKRRTPGEPAPRPVEAPEPHQDELGLQHLEEHARALAKHQQEARNSRWASDAETSFRADLTDLQSVNAAATRVDCRATSCTVELEWPTYEAAVAHYGEVLTHSYRTNCARQLVLPDPADHSKPYRATAIFNCEAPQAGQSG